MPAALGVSSLFGLAILWGESRSSAGAGALEVACLMVWLFVMVIATFAALFLIVFFSRWTLESLEFLYLDGTDVTEAGLEHLKVLPNLLMVFLDDTHVSEETAREFNERLRES